MEKKIIVKDWRDREIELNKEEYVRRFVDSVEPGLSPLRWDWNEECDDIANRVAEMAGKKFEMIYEYEKEKEAKFIADMMDPNREVVAL